MQALPPGLPPETQEVYQRYLNSAPASKAVLKNRVESYLETVKNASGENEFLDLTTAHAIGRTLNRLIDLSSEEFLCHVQAATQYFIDADDAAPDLESILGFDDDAEVVNAVCRHLGCPGLQVEL